MSSRPGSLIPLLRVAGFGGLQVLEVKASPVEHALDCEIGRHARPMAVGRERVTHWLKAEQANGIDYLLRCPAPTAHKIEVGLADHPGGEKK